MITHAVTRPNVTSAFMMMNTDAPGAGDRILQHEQDRKERITHLRDLPL